MFQPSLLSSASRLITNKVGLSQQGSLAVTTFGELCRGRWNRGGDKLDIDSEGAAGKPMSPFDVSGLSV